MSNTSSQMGAVAAQAEIGQAPVTRTLTVVVTGDPLTDLLVAFRRIAEESGLPSRQLQRIFECCRSIYKDSADAQDAIAQASRQWAAPATSPVFPPPAYPPQYDYTMSSDTNAKAPKSMFLEDERRSRQQAAWEVLKDSLAATDRPDRVTRLPGKPDQLR